MWKRFASTEFEICMCVCVYMEVLDDMHLANTPRTNLSESKHGSWFASQGKRKLISLYDACVSDLANALMQSAKQHAYSMGRHLGEGPSLQTLIDRANTRRNQRPSNVARVINSSASGTPMHCPLRPMEGDKETVRRKRRPSNMANLEENASHRPEYVYINVDRARKCGKSTSKVQNDNPIGDDVCLLDGKEVVERDIHTTQWAIRRTQLNSRVKCLGVIPNQGNCGRPIYGSTKGIPAPCFFGTRTHSHAHNGTHQFMWFCPRDSTHTWQPIRSISRKPCTTPSIWPVARGTSLTTEEAENLKNAGFVLETRELDTKSPNLPQGHHGPASTSHKDGSPEHLTKGVRFKTRTGVSIKAKERIQRSLDMMGFIKTVKVVRDLAHEVFVLVSLENDPPQEYEVHISNSPACSCPDFQKRHVQKRSFVACKHMYFVYLRVLGLDQNHSMFIHQPQLSPLQVRQALLKPRDYL